MNLTNDVGTIKHSKRLLDVRHYNACLLIPWLVYHLSTKLNRQILSQYLANNYEINLIHFLTRFGYATRTSPYCKLHGTYIHYMKVKNMLYINDCQDKERIIPATLFLSMLFNACFTYQESNASNMLIDALDTFNLKSTLHDYTFMNTLHKYISSFKFFRNILHHKFFSPLIFQFCFIDELSFFVYN